MHERIGNDVPSAGTEPPRLDDDSGSRAAYRIHGWVIAVVASALLWALVVGAVWMMVAAVT